MPVVDSSLLPVLDELSLDEEPALDEDETLVVLDEVAVPVVDASRPVELPGLPVPVPVSAFPSEASVPSGSVQPSTPLHGARQAVAAARMTNALRCMGGG